VEEATHSEMWPGETDQRANEYLRTSFVAGWS
jgi:hypothetical protein